MKQRDVRELGMYGEEVDIDPTEPQTVLLEEIERLNEDSRIHGIIVQDDYPDHVDWEAAIEAIDPRKDVDGLHPENIGRVPRSSRTFLWHCRLSPPLRYSFGRLDV